MLELAQGMEEALNSFEHQHEPSILRREEETSVNTLERMRTRNFAQIFGSKTFLMTDRTHSQRQLKAFLIPYSQLEPTRIHSKQV